MCLLILQKKNTNIEEDSLKNAYQSNPDGVGYSYIGSERIVTKKFRKYKKFLSNYNNDIKMFGNKSHFLLHFRLATHGSNEGTTNVHPFKVRDGLMFAHNGIISEVDDDKKLSDTQVFNRDILQGLKQSFLRDTIIIKLLEGFLGTSKLAFLDIDGSYAILNEDLGSWEDNVWYSNNSHSRKPYVYKQYSTGWGDYGYGYSTKETFNYANKKATQPHKASATPNLVCEYCGDHVNSLEHIDISDMYEDGNPNYLWMCDICIDLEDSLRDDEEASYNDSFNSKDTVAMTILGGKA